MGGEWVGGWGSRGGPGDIGRAWKTARPSMTKRSRPEASRTGAAAAGTKRPNASDAGHAHLPQRRVGGEGSVWSALGGRTTAGGGCSTRREEGACGGLCSPGGAVGARAGRLPRLFRHEVRRACAPPARADPGQVPRAAAARKQETPHELTTQAAEGAAPRNLPPHARLGCTAARCTRALRRARESIPESRSPRPPSRGRAPLRPNRRTRRRRGGTKGRIFW